MIDAQQSDARDWLDAEHARRAPTWLAVTSARDFDQDALGQIARHARMISDNCGEQMDPKHAAKFEALARACDEIMCLAE